MWIDLRGLKSQWNEYHTRGLVHRNHMQEKIKGNRPATPNGRENIHGNLPDWEWLTNNWWTMYNKQLWTRTPWIAPSISICRSVVFLSGLPAKPRLCWIMNNAWAVHEQFMNNVGLAFLANTWHESFGKWYLIVRARTCLRDWKKHSQRLLKKIHEQVALHSLRRNRLRDCLKKWPA